MSESERKQETEELTISARCNLDNLARAVPGIQEHPLFKIVRWQLRCAECLILRKGPPPIDEKPEAR